MKYFWSGRLATPEEIERFNRDADEAERLYFEAGLADVPPNLAESHRSPQADADADPSVIVDNAEGERRP